MRAHEKANIVGENGNLPPNLSYASSNSQAEVAFTLDAYDSDLEIYKLKTDTIFLGKKMKSNQLC